MNSRLETVSDPDYQYNLEKSIKSIEKRIQKKKSDKIRLKGAAVQYDRDYKKIINSMQRGDLVPKEAQILGHDLAVARDKVSSLADKNDRATILISEQEEELDKLEEKWEKLLVIGKKYGIGEQTIHPRPKGKLIVKCDEKNKAKETLLAAIKNQEIKRSIMITDYEVLQKERRKEYKVAQNKLHRKQQYINIYIYIYIYIYI